ncbi:hypothetical protein DdX_08208 [Ditylenchus destructor]|uniref:Uncharacterized protein n=1 Tax=Ditylenchus destructor TaxID=166010 RepID=A0AAD4N644_9BILA|nr:hypothetical protein DdX_08208 [Ditylenchus destructor]
MASGILEFSGFLGFSEGQNWPCPAVFRASDSSFCSSQQAEQNWPSFRAGRVAQSQIWTQAARSAAAGPLLWCLERPKAATDVQPNPNHQNIAVARSRPSRVSGFKNNDRFPLKITNPYTILTQSPPFFN